MREAFRKTGKNVLFQRTIVTINDFSPPDCFSGADRPLRHFAESLLGFLQILNSFRGFCLFRLPPRRTVGPSPKGRAVRHFQWRRETWGAFSFEKSKSPTPRKRNPGGFRNLAHRRGDTIPGHYSWPPIVPLPRNRLALSATGGASAISPRTPLKRPDQGGLRAPLFWTSSPGNTNSAVLLCARVAAAGQEGQIALNLPKSAPQLHLRERSGANYAGQRSRHKAEIYCAPIRSTSVTKQKRQPRRGLPFCGTKHFSFAGRGIFF